MAFKKKRQILAYTSFELADSHEPQPLQIHRFYRSLETILTTNYHPDFLDFTEKPKERR